MDKKFNGYGYYLEPEKKLKEFEVRELNLEREVFKVCKFNKISKKY